MRLNPAVPFRAEPTTTEGPVRLTFGLIEEQPPRRATITFAILGSPTVAFDTGTGPRANVDVRDGARAGDGLRLATARERDVVVDARERTLSFDARLVSEGGAYVTIGLAVTTEDGETFGDATQVTIALPEGVTSTMPAPARAGGTGARKKTGAKKTAGRKTAAKKAKKAATKKTAAKRTAAKKTKKAAAKKTKKAAAKRTKKAAAKKSTAKKSTRKSAAKKSPARRSTTKKSASRKSTAGTSAAKRGTARKTAAKKRAATRKRPAARRAR